MNRCSFGRLLCVAVALPLATSDAGVICDNGAPNALTGGLLSDLDADTRAGDDFVLLSGASTLEEIRWWGFYLVSATPSDDFTLAVYELEAGFPAVTPIWALHAGAVARTELEPLVYEYDLAVAPVPLTPGQTYVLSIFNHSAAGVDDEWSWYTSGEGSGFRWLGGEPPTPIDRELAFQLFGPIVPAPPMGVLGVALVPRPRRWGPRSASRRVARRAPERRHDHWRRIQHE